MKKTKIAYWIITGLLSAFIVMGAIPDMLSVPDAVAMFDQLGYPAYLLPFLGIAKLLGVAAILIPGFPRIKEWAYAGITFDLAGAMYSTIASGAPIGGSIFFVVLFLAIALSYKCYHVISRARAGDDKSRRHAALGQAV